MIINLETLLFYSDSIRLPHEISIPVIRHFLKCRKNNGNEWAVQRFKGIKTDFINLKAGLPLTSSWVARKKNNFSGPFRGLQSWWTKRSQW